MKKKLLIIPLSIVLVALSGCATTKFVGYGTVEQQAFLKYPAKKMGESTAVGAGTGVVLGAGLGAGVGAGLGALSGGLLMVPGILIGAGAGAFLGSALGGTTGYIYGVDEQGLGLFAYNVKPDYQKSLLKFKQYSKASLPKNTRVKVYQTHVNNRIVYHIAKAPMKTQKAS